MCFFIGGKHWYERSINAYLGFIVVVNLGYVMYDEFVRLVVVVGIKLR